MTIICLSATSRQDSVSLCSDEAEQYSFSKTAVEGIKQTGDVVVTVLRRSERGGTKEADGGQKLYLRYSSPQSKSNIFSALWKEKKGEKSRRGRREKKSE